MTHFGWEFSNDRRNQIELQAVPKRHWILLRRCSPAIPDQQAKSRTRDLFLRLFLEAKAAPREAGQVPGIEDFRAVLVLQGPIGIHTGL